MNPVSTSTRSASRPAVARRLLMVASGLVAVNLVTYGMGRAAHGAFTYRQDGRPTHVDVIAILFMTVVPLAAGLLVATVTARRWPRVITVARVVAPLLAVVTIFVMPVAASFDAASTVSLAVMHFACGVAALAGLRIVDTS